MSNNAQLDKEEEILRLISDQCARRIINTIQEESKSALQISKELGTELSTIYRRLNKFQKYGLLKTTFQITPDGKKSYYYQCKINAINASYRQGKFQVSLAFN
ncbi:winged helix-turn-helix domain-containing protein [Nitrosopumilus sp.]|uniref:ArsR/SmtB family transcription factor n=1 Tax=Nitrosopumilus sp. TaxID=2024843 RepID=UPI00292F2337|nr:winged helix-turn-helix domain-containing protein [Nitrosopumilus sp.]